MEPVEDFIPRSANPEVQEYLNMFSSWIEEIVNFGSHLVSWSIKKVKGEDEELIPILFLRNYLEYVDACSILIKQSSIEPCNTLLRTLLENFLYIEYLLEKDTQQRSLNFLVWNAFENRKVYLSMDGRSDPYKNIKASFKKDKLFHDEIPIILPGIDKLIKNNIKLLESEKYKSTVIEFEKTKQDSNKNPNWYSLNGGPRKIDQLALKLGFPAYYEILYRGLSSSTHGTAIIQGKIAKNPKYGVDIYQIRLPKDAQTVTTMCFNLSTYLFKTYVNSRLPEKTIEFETWINSIKHIFKTLEVKGLITIK